MNVIIEQNSMIPMRDGIKLATDIYRPAQEGQWPVLVTRHPYNKDFRFPFPGWEDRRMAVEVNLFAERVVEAGYVIVVQDVRGRYASEGDFIPFLFDAQDGVDTIAWAASQPWSSGQVGMFGVSYQALAQWQAAIAQPAALRALAPSQSPHAGGLYPYQGGAFMPAMVLGLLGSLVPEEVKRRADKGQATSADMEQLTQALGDFQAQYTRLPLTDQPVLRNPAPYYFDWLAHPDFDDYWRTSRPEDFYKHVSIPTLTISGWHDIFLLNDLRQHQGMKQYGGSALARQQQHLVVGPWAHGNFMWGYPDRSYGEGGAAASPLAVSMLTDIQLRWYDHWLKGLDNGVEQAKPVRIFVMGIDQWREEEAWPLPDTHYRPYYLHSGGHANTAHGDGTLSTKQMVQGSEDVYCYDPHNPVLTISGFAIDPKQQGNPGPYDQREIEKREDVLCYTTAPLEHPVEVTGPIELVLYVSSSACDTDFTGKLVDVHPDGRAERLTDGILRARYRESLEQPVLMEPDYIYELHIDLGATSNVFLAGHRIRLEVSSSNFPRFDRNSNTGGTIATEQAEDFVPAINHVHHNEAYPSHVILPIIERAG